LGAVSAAALRLIVSTALAVHAVAHAVALVAPWRQVVTGSAGRSLVMRTWAYPGLPPSAAGALALEMDALILASQLWLRWPGVDTFPG
jgi:hypothetical protein